MDSQSADGRRPRASLALLLLSLVAAVAASSPQPRIVNGSATSSHPSTGLIQTPLGLCSGVLVGCRTFLTAAHCFCETTPGATCANDPAALDASQTVVFLQHDGFVDAASVKVHSGFAFGGASLSTADIAVVSLASPVSGIRPSPLAQAKPAAGSDGTIVGFGSSSVVRGVAVGTGIKREGAIFTRGCGSGLVCWSFSGSGANTCFGDSGGPLFAGSGDAVAGITSGGTSDTCSAGDLAFDTDVAAYSGWIQGAAGETLGTARCSDLPNVGDTGVTVVTSQGSWDSQTRASVAFEVPAQTAVLRVTTNGTLDGDADLYVRAGAKPTAAAFDCAGHNGSAFETCEIASPKPGTWYATVDGVTGTGDYQLTASTFVKAAPGCGNGVLESGEQCDGASASACGGRCADDCSCVPCQPGPLALRKLRSGARLRIQAALENANGAYDAFDPRLGFALVLRDAAGHRLDLSLPAGDPGWKQTRRGFRWRGDAGGLRQIVLRLRAGEWRILARGRDLAGAQAIDDSTLGLSVSAGPTCVAAE